MSPALRLRFELLEQDAPGETLSPEITAALEYCNDPHGFVKWTFLLTNTGIERGWFWRRGSESKVVERLQVIENTTGLKREKTPVVFIFRTPSVDRPLAGVPSGRHRVPDMAVVHL
jgi:hypothetical protein